MFDNTVQYGSSIEYAFVLLLVMEDENITNF
jgi:hypothetical protein